MPFQESLLDLDQIFGFVEPSKKSTTQFLGEISVNNTRESTSTSNAVVGELKVEAAPVTMAQNQELGLAAAVGIVSSLLFVNSIDGF